MPTHSRARKLRTAFLATRARESLACIRRDIETLIRRADRLSLRPAVRLNGTSDLDWTSFPLWPDVNGSLLDQFPTVDFYDYSKSLDRCLADRPSNYHLTYSRSERSTPSDILRALAAGISVATVFHSLPEILPERVDVLSDGTFRAVDVGGYSILSGDVHDARFLDSRGSIVALSAKGKAIRSAGSFATHLETLS